MNKLLIISLLTAALLYGCLNGSSDVEGTLKKIDRKVYNLISPYPDNNITITFNNNQASGFAGVNSYTARIETGPNKIKFLDIASTKAMGPAKLMAIENDFLSSLKNASKIVAVKDEVRLGNLVFKEAK